jgi:hypothetical protein
VFAYRMIGLLVHSEFELPELRATAQESGLPDVVIRRGAVPSGSGVMESAGECAPYIVGPDGFYLEREHVGRYRVTNGDRVTVDACRGADDVDVRVFLLGSVFGALCYQRGLLPLHASAVAHEGQGYAFAGPSGTGKSTISAGLCARGFEFVADDICPIAFTAGGQPQVLESVRKLKLSEETLRVLGREPRGQLRDHQESSRYHIPVAETADPFPVPLRSIYMFRRVDDDAGLRIDEISPAYAVRCLQQLTYMPRYPLAADEADEHFLRCVALAGSVSLFEVYHRPGLERLPGLLGGLSDHLRQTASTVA